MIWEEEWAGRDCFVVCDTQLVESGLRGLLQVACRWRAQPPAHSPGCPPRLHYLAVVPPTLSRAVVKRMLEEGAGDDFPEEVEALLAVFPFHQGVEGTYLRLNLGESYSTRWRHCHPISLTLMYGTEPLPLLRQLEATVDTVLLKASCNTQLEELSRLVRPYGVVSVLPSSPAQTSQIHTQLVSAAFTPVGAVGDGLGMLYRKTKSEQLHEWLTLNQRPPSDRLHHNRPSSDRRTRRLDVMCTGFVDGSVLFSLRPPELVLPQALPGLPERFELVGGGVAGCALVAAIRARGMGDSIVSYVKGEGASSNPLGLVMPRPTAEETLAGSFHTQAFMYATNMLRGKVYGEQSVFEPLGVLELSDGNKSRVRHQKLLSAQTLPGDLLEGVSAGEASKISGVSGLGEGLEVGGGGGLFYPSAGIVRPHALCGYLRSGPGAKQENTTQEGCFEPHEANWSPNTVRLLAAGMSTLRFAGAEWLPLVPKGGQVSMMRATRESEGLRCGVSAGCYMTPALIGCEQGSGHKGSLHLAGASYEHMEATDSDAFQGLLPSLAASDWSNLVAVSRIFPQAGWTASHVVGARRSVRATTPDRLPVAGPVPDKETYVAAFGPKLQNPRAVRSKTCKSPETVNSKAALAYRTEQELTTELLSLSGLSSTWVLSGLGSRGLMTAPLCAELMLSQMLGEPWPVPRAVALSVHPARFLSRLCRRM